MVHGDIREAAPQLIVHVIHELGVGGLENGLVNLINAMPRDRYRHAIVCMTRFTEFRDRIRRDDVEVVALGRGSMPLWRMYLSLAQLLRRWRPAIVHSRNLSGLDALIPAWCAGVSFRVHGEHGRDADDLDGKNPKNLRLRRLFRPFVTRYVTVSKDLERYLAAIVGVSPERVTQIYNGVDGDFFRPRSVEGDRSFPDGPSSEETVLIGTVGRLQPVKDQVMLVEAFADAVDWAPDVMRAARLVIVGDGPCRGEIEAAVHRTGMDDRVSLLGARDDVAEVMRTLDLFVLPSLSEGISNTILEAMATGLPVVATRVGGNSELVVDGETGRLVDVGDRQSMAQALIAYTRDRELRRRHGNAGRQRVEARFSINAMVQAYLNLYDGLLGSRYAPRARDAASGV